MPKYKYVITYDDGSDDYDSYEYDGESGLFDTYEEAEEEALYAISCHKEGAEILHMSNPGDYDFDEDDDAYYEIIEV